MTLKQSETSESVIQQAARWFIKLRPGQVTVDLDKKFNDWLREDPEREAAYNRCELTGKLIGELASDPELRPVIQQCSRLREEFQERKSGNVPGLVDWLLCHRLSFTTAALVFVATVLAIIINVMPVTYRTEIGELRTVIMEDSSAVTLNTNSKVTVHYSSETRLIRLERGEVFFEVAQDPSRPFEVIAGNGLVKAIGTSFGVELSGDKVTVSVLEGKVVVIPNIKYAEEQHGKVKTRKLEVGEALEYWSNGVVAEVNIANKKRITAWREGKLNFDGLRLADAIKEHNRYSLHKIVLGSDDARNLAISGIFRIGDTESLLYLLEQSLGLQAIERDDMILLVKPSKSRLADPTPEPVELPTSG